MFKLLLVTSHRGALSGLAAAMAEREDVEVSQAESGEDALLAVSETPIDLVVADEDLGDMTGLELAGRLLRVNPMINCAIVSPLSAEAFHEASEGLGIMAQLPVKPGKKQAEELLNKLKKLKSLEAGFKDARSMRYE